MKRILGGGVTHANLSDVTGNPEELVRMRGKFSTFEMSDLEDICTILVSEAEVSRFSKATPGGGIVPSMATGEFDHALTGGSFSIGIESAKGGRGRKGSAKRPGRDHP